MYIFLRYLETKQSRDVSIFMTYAKREITLLPERLVNKNQTILYI